MEANESLAYIAGFLDGEGCLMISRSGAKSSIVVQITNSDEDVIHYINTLLPGRVYGQKRYGRKEIHRLVWTGENAVNVIELLLPYLFVKKRLAEIMLDYYAEITDCIRFRASVSDVRESYRVEVSRLNGR